MIFGDGRLPINFIAVDDLARTIIALLDDPAAQNQVIDLAGPEDLSLLQVVELYERHVGHPVKRKHIPIAALRVMRRLVRPFNPVLSRMMSGGLELATKSPTINAPRKADFAPTTFEQWLGQDRRA
jgi:nucleoside-diphosphate-sugar epimerase